MALPTSDYRNLGSESLQLYSRTYAREGALLEHYGHLLFRCYFRATMKVGVRYRVHLAFARDGDFFGKLVYSACECVGGAPPATCKHVGGVCHGFGRVLQEWEVCWVYILYQYPLQMECAASPETSL